MKLKFTALILAIFYITTYQVNAQNTTSTTITTSTTTTAASMPTTTVSMPTTKVSG